MREGFLYWEQGEETHVPDPTCGLLGSFSRLWRRPDEEIAAFARRFGVLFLHPDDRRHGAWCAACALACGGSLNTDLPNVFLEHGAEPLDAWRRLARDVGGCLLVASLYARDELVDLEVWKLFGNVSNVKSLPLPKMKGFVSASVPESPDGLIAYLPPRVGQLGPPSQIVMHLVNLMLRRTTPRLVLWPDGTRRLQIEPAGLLGEIGLQLAREIAGASAFAVCVGCAEIFAPSRRPRVGERSWCLDCRDKKRDQRVASQDYRRSRR